MVGVQKKITANDPESTKTYRDEAPMGPDADLKGILKLEEDILQLEAHSDPFFGNCFQ